MNWYYYLLFSIYFTSSLQARTSDSYQEELLERLILAQPGEVIELPEGTFHFDRQLSLYTDNVKIIGKGMHKTMLSFKSQVSGGEGLFISANNIHLEGFTIQDTKGDAIKFLEADGVTIKAVQARWTNGPSPDNGGYGLYPVKSKNILIEGCRISGASDAGIYVGQSENITVKQNDAFHNVAGIEIENSAYANVYDNYVHDNSAGILVFNLPQLSMLGHHTKVFSNTIVHNNIDNFSSPQNIIANVPRGTGLLILANSFVEVYQNTFSENDTASIILASYLLFNKVINDENFDPFTSSIFIHNNTFFDGGNNPKGGSNEESRKLISELKSFLSLPFPHIIYDGFTSSEEKKIETFKNKAKICLKDNIMIDFINIDAPNNFQNPTQNTGQYDCKLDINF
tara:strand:- start:2235 stop:3428 length:1194 start_codon:yes stop_codon:yes gene_type:complete